MMKMSLDQSQFFARPRRMFRSGSVMLRFRLLPLSIISALILVLGLIGSPQVLAQNAKHEAPPPISCTFSSNGYGTQNKSGTTPQFTTPGGSFKAPLRIAPTESGWLLVTDTRRRAVFRVAPDLLVPDQTLYTDGKPLAVGEYRKEIFVGIEDLQTVEIFDLGGNHTEYLVPPGTIGHPGDLAIDKDAGILFVLDGEARNVLVFNLADRSLIGSVGTGILMAPTSVAVDVSRQEILVSDYGSSNNAATVKFLSYADGSFGNHTATISGAGTCNFMGCEGGFSRPRGLTIHNSRVYLVDAIFAQVLVFDRNTLELLETLGSGDASTRDLRNPSDIEINGCGDIYIANTMLDSLVVFPGAAQ